VCQALSPFFHQDLIRGVYQTVARTFPIVMPYLAVIPTYPSGMHCFMLGSKRHHPLKVLRPKAHSFKTRWYTPEVHRAAFSLPPLVASLVGETGESDHATGHG